MNRLQYILVLTLLPFISLAKDYRASLFGIKSDGKTLNTRSFQKGIDFISENGGGNLVFEVGRYLTGAVQLKSNVTIKLEEGAVIVGSPSIYDYNSAVGIKAIISASNQSNIGISGKGVIEGRGNLLLSNMKELQAKGFLLDSLTVQPALIGFENCTGIHIDSINLIDAAATIQQFKKCKNITIASIAVKSKNNAAPGLVFTDNVKVSIINTYVEVGGKPLVWEGSVGDLKLENSKNQEGKPLQ